MVKKVGKQKTFIILGVVAIIGGVIGALNATTLPAADGSFVEQAQAVKNWCTFSTFGFPAFAMLIIVIIFITFNLEKMLPQIHKDLKIRNRGMTEEASV